jgi:hypothetical protein
LSRRFADRDFLTANPHLGKYVKLLPLGKCSDELTLHERAEEKRAGALLFYFFV